MPHNGHKMATSISETKIIGEYQTDKYIKIVEWKRSFMIQDINQLKSAGNLKTIFLFSYESVFRFLDIRYLPLVDRAGFTIDLISMKITTNFLFAMVFLCFPKYQIMFKILIVYIYLYRATGSLCLFSHVLYHSSSLCFPP